MPRSSNRRPGEHVFSVQSSNATRSFSSPPSPPPPQERNRPFRLDARISDEEHIRQNEDKFYLSLDILLNDSPKTRRAKKNKKKNINKPPRPQNAFMLYRRSKCQELKDLFDGDLSSNVSEVIGQYWRDESPEIKELYQAAARVAEAIHAEKYKDYKYEPRKPKSRQRKEKRKVVSNEENNTMESSYPSPNLSNLSSCSQSPFSSSSSDFSTCYPSPASSQSSLPSPSFGFQQLSLVDEFHENLVPDLSEIHNNNTVDYEINNQQPINECPDDFDHNNIMDQQQQQISEYIDNLNSENYCDYPGFEFQNEFSEYY